MKANAQTEAAIKGVINKFLEAYQKRDIELLMSVFPEDEDQVMYGTGADEKRIGRDQIRRQAERDWSQTEQIAFSFPWIQVSAHGPVAWIAGDGFGKGKAGGQAFQFPLRMTGVFVQRGNDWFLVQSHISLPATAQDAGDSVPV
jgi:ketosteroid isomerase-like protein